MVYVCPLFIKLAGFLMYNLPFPVMIFLPLCLHLMENVPGVPKAKSVVCMCTFFILIV